jgi:drug/metabolite transporter (DMT)-like permease
LTAGTAWGLPYLFIRIAVEDFSTSSMIFLRVVIGAVILIPIAIHRKELFPLLKEWKFVLAYGLIQIVGPWYLVTEAERSISSGMAGLLSATVPIFGMIIGYFYLGDKSLAHPKTLIGVVVGFAGIILLVGIDALTSKVDFWSMFMVILAAAAYAIAPTMTQMRMPQVSGIALNGFAMAMISVLYLIPASMSLPAEIAASVSAESWFSVLGLGVICSAIAFVAFSALTRAIGVARAGLITYMNMVVAVLLGILILQEPITQGMLIGFPMVLFGSYFATRKH